MAYFRRAEFWHRTGCGEYLHFNALKVGESPARYEVATSVEELLAGIGAD